jgi:hypothetical protein
VREDGERRGLSCAVHRPPNCASTSRRSSSCGAASSAKADPEVLTSIPTRSSRRLGGDVVGHAVDAAHLVDDPARDARQQLVRQRRPVGVMKSLVCTARSATTFS